MKRLIKVALGFTILATFGNAHADEGVSEVTVVAEVAASCNLDAFTGTVNLNGQIDPDGATGKAGYKTPIKIQATQIICTDTPAWTQLKMSAGSEQGIKSGDNVLRYDVTGTFGNDGAASPAAIEITPFNSLAGPPTDLLGGAGVKPAGPEGTPALEILLTAGQTANAGNYSGKLIITVTTGS